MRNFPLMGCRKLTYTETGETPFLTVTKNYGHKKSGESLFIYGARYYAPWTCRFVSVDPLTGKHPNKTPYHYCSNNPINKVDPTGMEDVPAGGGGGGDGKASDGTGASDHQGRDIVKVNGVSYETWKGENGTIYAQQTGDANKGHTTKSANNIANKDAREAIKNHWGSEPKQQEEQVKAPLDTIQEKDSSSLEPQEVQPSETTNTPKETQSPNSSGSGQPQKQTESLKKDINDVNSTMQDVYNPIGKIVDIFDESANHVKDQLKNDIEVYKKKVETKTGVKPKSGPPRLQNYLKQIQPIADVLKNLGRGFTLASIFQVIVDFATKPMTLKSMAAAILDISVEIASALTGFAGIALSFAYDVFKEIKTGYDWVIGKIVEVLRFMRKQLTP